MSAPRLSEVTGHDRSRNPAPGTPGAGGIRMARRGTPGRRRGHHARATAPVAQAGRDRGRWRVRRRRRVRRGDRDQPARGPITGSGSAPGAPGPASGQPGPVGAQPVAEPRVPPAFARPARARPGRHWDSRPDTDTDTDTDVGTDADADIEFRRLSGPAGRRYAKRQPVRDHRHFWAAWRLPLARRQPLTRIFGMAHGCVRGGWGRHLPGRSGAAPDSPRVSQVRLCALSGRCTLLCVRRKAPDRGAQVRTMMGPPPYVGAG
jgi:hypothetical protein